MIFYRIYILPEKRGEIVSTFRILRKRKGMIIDSRVAFSGFGVLVGSLLAEELREFLNIPLGSVLDWLLLVSGAVLGGFYGYYSLISLRKSFEGWEKIVSAMGDL
jgi:hypothetical protein